MIKKVAMVAISAIIGVLLVVTVLTPILMGATSETLTTKNTGSFFAAVSDDDTEHTIVISAGTGSFVIKTDDKVDITPSMATYNPGGVYVADAIAIGVYEAYSDNGVLVSQSGKTPASNTKPDTYHTRALANNDKVTFGTYQLWNYFQYTMVDRIMPYVVIGNTDSQYMMGPGDCADNLANNTGLTTSAYSVSSQTGDSVCIFVENSYGSRWEVVGDTYFLDYQLFAGNTLGGNKINDSSLDNVLVGTYTIPENADNNLITGINITSSEAFGLPTSIGDTTIVTDGNGLNDGMWSEEGKKCLIVGGRNYYTTSCGLNSISTAFATNYSGSTLGTRLAYIIPELTTNVDYGYVITFGTDGNTITNVQVLDDGVLTDTNPDLTGETPVLNDYWDFDTTTGIGPFGAYYVAINLSDVDTESDTDYLAETMLGTKKGEIAYIVDPTDFTKTLGGTSYTSGNYNVMLVVPTMYWGVVDSKLYMSNDPSTFSDVEGLELQPYAHTYTIDPSVDTGNPVTTASATIVYGADYIVRLYSTGDVYLITENAMTYLGQASGENTVELTVTGDVLGYTPSGGSATTIDDVLAFIASTGEYVQCKNPMYSTSQEGAQFIIGGYANNLTTTTDDVVDIGYCLTVDAADLSLSTITVLNPVSDASNTVDTNGAVWGESTLIKSDLYKVGDLTITTTWSDTGKSVATYNYYLAPEKVTYTNPNYLDNGPVESILNVLPIIIVAGLLLGILSMIVVGKLKE